MTKNSAKILYALGAETKMFAGVLSNKQNKQRVRGKTTA